MDAILTSALDFAYALFLFFLWVLFFLFASFAGWSFFSSYAYRKKVHQALEKEDQQAYLVIKIPPTNLGKEKAMEDLLRSLHRVLPNNAHISLEMASSDQFMRFYIVTSSHLRNVVESQLYAQFPDAEVEQIKDYLPDLSEKASIVELHFKKPSMYPLNTYQNLEEDILKNLSAILSKTESKEKVVIQLALKRVGSKFYERGYRAGYFKIFGTKSRGDDPHPAHVKLSQDIFMGKLRLAYIAEDKGLAQQKLSTLLGLFKSLKGPHNELKKKRFSFGSITAKSFKTRMFQKGDLWFASELATLYHFPGEGSTLANVVNVTSKRAPAPDILPREGLVRPEDVSFFGETNYRNDRKKFGLKRFDRRRHLYVVGKTGSGKSRLLELLLLADIQGGHGCCLIDPHGDLADELLMFVPEHRIKDVIYVNPSDRDFPIGFNPLEPVEDYQVRQHLSTFFIAIFKKLFADTWNPRMEHLIRYITLALLETPDSNIMGIPRILSDTKYRQKVIMQIKDPVVKSFWTNEFSGYNEQFASVAVVPILNKVGQFIANPVIRNMVGQRQNMLDFEHFMNTGKIVIINLSKGKLGDENAALLGSMFITKIQQAALARASIPEDDRRDFYFYVDEFQNFATDAFSSILSEARKYHLDLTIAHQYIAQLPEEVKATAFGNVGSLITFAIGGDDAAYLAKEFAPVFSPEDMISLNTREMYIKMSIDGKLTPPFSAKTLSVPKPSFDYSVEIVEHSRATYGKDRASVEEEIARWASGTSSVIDDNSGGSQAPVEDEFPEPIL